MGIRSFLAFELPLEIRNVLDRVSEENRSSLGGIRWVRVGNIHLTVIFMGNVNEDRLESLGWDVMEVCRGYGPFRVRLNGTGYFGRRSSPRVIWAGLEGDTARMSRFRDELQARLVPFGIREEDRPFRPHLTLGRFKKGERVDSRVEAMLAENDNLTSPWSSLDELALFRSDLKPGGAVYTKLNAWALQARC